MSTASKASFARKHWDRATRHGTHEATTTFHETYNKHDYHYTYGRCGEFVRQDGQRGLALGYLTKVRFTKFLQTREGEELTGVDCSRPGGDAEREERMRVVSNAFFELLVKYSQSHPHRDGDYGNVARSRKLQEGSFCIFTGFSEALASEELEAMRKQWKERYDPSLTPTAPEPEPEPEPEAELEPEPEPEPKLEPEPELYEFDVSRVGVWSADTWLRFLQKTQEECLWMYKHASDPETIEPLARMRCGCQVYDRHPEFVVQCKQPRRKSNKFLGPQTTIFFKGVLKKRWKFQPLHTPTESDLTLPFHNAMSRVRLWSDNVH